MLFSVFRIIFSDIYCIDILIFQIIISTKICRYLLPFYSKIILAFKCLIIHCNLGRTKRKFDTEAVLNALTCHQVNSDASAISSDWQPVGTVLHMDLRQALNYLTTLLLGTKGICQLVLAFKAIALTVITIQSHVNYHYHYYFESNLKGHGDRDCDRQSFGVKSIHFCSLYPSVNFNLTLLYEESTFLQKLNENKSN